MADTLSKQILGIISDTHGLLRPEVARAFSGVSMILHAGDVGRPRILSKLEELAPVTAVRGNMDGGSWASPLPPVQALEVGPVWIYMLHDLNGIDLDPAAAGFRMVVSGHTHRPAVDRRGGVLYLNPGSAGPRRFDYPITVARIALEDDRLTPEIVHLEP